MALNSPPATLSSNTATTLSPFSIPVRDYLKLNPSMHHIVAAALVFSPSTPYRILIVQRAANDFMPNCWEIPGGSCDLDESILAAAARELQEESGLVATKVVQQVGQLGVWLDKEKLWCKYSFEVEVERGEVKLDEEEHQAFFWATEEECREGVVVRDGKSTKLEWTRGGSQLATILEGFRLRSQRSEAES
ncbi:uncharacterized protein LY89DRAFT_784656 [Mollisia scopiformis]|uniref:Nudix hydrolase domain-containing protein n=1 Tax=Mollisia scopiformis TaxID=149040 RepID=A0A194X0S6_MOLSC|nr:uncharacterized protein LY89DRAFT_784656 [Mollisia scopiformis]KUJ13790.1 hypothetical protein LY89DRAFT_784656 [Mollisia scopiformis]